jgi:hypothetical protein
MVFSGSNLGSLAIEISKKWFYDRHAERGKHSTLPIGSWWVIKNPEGFVLLFLGL